MALSDFRFAGLKLAIGAGSRTDRLRARKALGALVEHEAA